MLACVTITRCVYNTCSSHKWYMKNGYRQKEMKIRNKAMETKIKRNETKRRRRSELLRFTTLKIPNIANDTATKLSNRYFIFVMWKVFFSACINCVTNRRRRRRGEERRGEWRGFSFHCDSIRNILFYLRNCKSVFLAFVSRCCCRSWDCPIVNPILFSKIGTICRQTMVQMRRY